MIFRFPNSTSNSFADAQSNTNSSSNDYSRNKDLQPELRPRLQPPHRIPASSPTLQPLRPLRFLQGLLTWPHGTILSLCLRCSNIEKIGLGLRPPSLEIRVVDFGAGGHLGALLGDWWLGEGERGMCFGMVVEWGEGISWV